MTVRVMLATEDEHRANLASLCVECGFEIVTAKPDVGLVWGPGWAADVRRFRAATGIDEGFVVLLMSDAADLQAALDAGVQALIHFTEEAFHIPAALNAAARGLPYLSAGMVLEQDEALARLAGGAPGDVDRSRLVAELPPRQFEAAALAASGWSNQEIGDRFFVTPGMVKHILRLAYRRLGVRRRGDLNAFRRALEARWSEGPSSESLAPPSSPARLVASRAPSSALRRTAA